MVFGAALVFGCATGGFEPGPHPSLTSLSATSDISSVVGGTVPAGGSVDIPLAFEGSSTATVTVYSNATGLSASFGATDLTETDTDTGSVLQATLADPVDGSLHIANPGTTDAKVSVVVAIDTTRHLTVTTGSSFVAVGHSFGVHVSISDTVSGDVPIASLVDPAGGSVAIALTPDGAASWTGTATATASGNNTIKATVAQNGTRFGSAGIAAASGTVTVGTGFGEATTDPDGDGLYNSLVLSPSVASDHGGSFLVSARLVDTSGNAVATLSQAVTLVAGTQTVNLAFDGESIYDSGRSGQYRLVDLAIFDTSSNTLSMESQVADLGLTSSYTYSQFQHGIPVSKVSAFAAPTTTDPVLSVAYAAAVGGSDPVKVELYQRFEPVGGSFGGWTLVGTATDSFAQPFSVAETADGTYEFYTIAYDPVGIHETKSEADASIVLIPAPTVPGKPTGVTATAGNGSDIGPVAMANPTSSTLNFPVGDDRANAVTVALDAGGTLSVTYAASTLGPTAQVIFDVTGYFTP